MQSSFTSLEDLGPVALSHRNEIEEVKRQLDIQHGYFDAWMYGFLENKKFNIEETVTKLQRRFAMEVNGLASIVVTDYMRESLRCGSHQFIGTDKLGRSVLLINVKRDIPDAAHAAERRAMFDLWMSYGTRLRRDGSRCQMVVIFNQEGANSKKNFDLAAIMASARHVAKFCPGALDKTYFCKMGRTLTTLAKPVLKAFPSFVTSKLEILSEADLHRGALLAVMDEAVLPVALGGKNDCDHPDKWRASAEAVEAYFADMQHALCTRGVRVKEYELECLGTMAEHPVDVHIEPSKQTPSFSAGSSVSFELQAGVTQECFSEVGSSPRSIEAGMSRRSSAVVVHASSPWTTHPLTVTADGTNNRSSRSLARTHTSERATTDAQIGTPEDDTLLRSPSWSSTVSPLSSAMALWFLDELLHWRENIEEAEREDRARLALLRSAAERKAAAQRALHVAAVADRKWYRRSLHGVTPLLLIAALLLNLVVLTASK